MQTWLRYYRTLKWIKPSQLLWRVWYRIYRPKPPACLPALQRAIPEKEWTSSIVRERRFFEKGGVTFLNHRELLTDSFFKDIAKLPKLWRYNFCYFESVLSSQKEERDTAIVWFERTVKDPCQPEEFWEPYPISLRIVNVLKSALAGRVLPEIVLAEIARAAALLARIPEYHLLGNHLFENAKALVFAGLFFKGEAPKRWLKLGWSILEREIPEQVLKDGGHFELSPMYHVIILEGMLDLYNVCRVYWYPFPAAWKDTISRMRRWLKVMTHPDGEISFFNDAAFKIAVSPQAIETYALRLGLEAVSDPGNGITILKESGYLRLQNENFVVLIDCAKVGPDYLPGHAHADTLSFECSFQGRRMLVNSGTSTYADPILRPWQRSTAAHNTVEVNRENSSEVWGQFRVGHRAKVLLKEIGSNQHVLKVEASHTGYSSQGVLHTRRWICTPTQFVVEDELSGGSGIARFYFHPDFDLHQIKIESQPTATFEVSDYYPEFGKTLKNSVACVSVEFKSRFIVSGR